MFKSKALASALPTLHAVESTNDVRGLDFNLRWMVKDFAVGDEPPSLAMHPFLRELVQRGLYWRKTHLERLNARAARAHEANEAKIVTLRQLAPLIVVTIATLASPGIIARTDIDQRYLPPLQHLYNELLTALSDRDGPLGKQFVKDSCAVLDSLERRNGSVVPPAGAAPSATTDNVARHAELGLPLVIVRTHCYADYLEVFGQNESIMSFDEYRKHYVEVVHKLRKNTRETTVKLLKDQKLASIHPTLPARSTTSDVRRLEFNRHWMLTSAAGQGSSIHPLLTTIVQRSMHWREVNSVAAVEAYLERLNKRTGAARAATGKHEPVTLQQLAPLFVITIATMANIGIVSHLGLDRNDLPPLQQLFHEAVAALNDRNGIFDQRFVDDSRALMEQLDRERMPMGPLCECPSDVPRDTQTGIALAVFGEREK
ncbi:hypothetical protein H9P43_006301 [Blastocladiella emersonii ATCC 22665]|nr:hypothetical protein H9P43_006301 [Blastocladiella emersonii ATCC 22665]